MLQTYFRFGVFRARCIGTIGRTCEIRADTHPVSASAASTITKVTGALDGPGIRTIAGHGSTARSLNDFSPAPPLAPRATGLEGKHVFELDPAVTAVRSGGLEEAKRSGRLQRCEAGPRRLTSPV
jgi:hypothetical protein